MKEQAELTGRRWNSCAEGYNGIIHREFHEDGDIWRTFLQEYAPCKGGRALDIGAGPGLFSILLAQLGWTVTGIDCAENMLTAAGKNAAVLGLDIRFERMDNHELSFPDNSFDYLVCRNVTWILYDPERAFREWLRVLRPGGRLLYLDANWTYQDDAVLRQAVAADEAAYRERYGAPVNTYRGDEATDAAFRCLPAFDHILRPDWDAVHLPEFGYVNVRIQPRMNERLYAPHKQLLYRSIPLFLVTADKP
jgi:SAM-dependent methyltransferase